MTLIRRLVAMLRRRRLERELEGEVLAHLELAEMDARAAGLSPEEARRVARRRFGNIERMKDEHRDRRSVRWIETLAADVRYGLVLLRRDLLFACVAVSVMAIGIGANTAMFSLTDALLLKPLPYPEPERIVRVWEQPPPDSRNGTTTLNFLDWKRLSTSFAALSAVRGLSAALTGQGDPVRLDGVLVSADYFDVFGLKPALGRAFLPGDDQPGAPRVVVLSYATWQGRFGGDPTLLNRDIMLDGEPHQVVGILPPTSASPFTDLNSFWKPLVFAPEQRTRDYHWLSVVGRLRRSVSLQQAQEEMRAIAANLSPLQPAWKRDWSIKIDPFDQDLVDSNLRQSIIVACGAVLMVLLIASANIANLLLARGVVRRREMAVRTALGASRGRLVAQVLTESLVLSLFGGLAGVGLAYLLIHVAAPLTSTTVPSAVAVTLDMRVFTFAAAVTIGVSLLVGILPALQMSASRPSQALNLATRGASGREGVRRAIVVAEVAVSLMLICGALLLFKSLFRLQHVDPGVRVDNVITMSADLSFATYPEPPAAVRFIDSVVERLQAIPGVESASVSTDVPMLGVRQGDSVTLPRDTGLWNAGVRFKRVDPNYFSTLDIPMLAGRAFAPSDRLSAPRVAIVNESLARRLAGKLGLRDPSGLVGRTVRVGNPLYENRGQTGSRSDVEIVGMIRDERVGDLDAPTPDVIYVALLQSPRRELRLIVRTRDDPSSMMPSIRQAVGAVDPRLPLGNVRTMAEVKQLTLAQKTEPAWIIGAFAGVATLLAALGLYGVLSHAVNQRRREIGIRMALGAASGDVLTHVLRNATRLIIVGLTVGLVGALALTRVMSTLLFQVSAMDPIAFTLAVVSMILVGLVAALIPATRASHVDPAVALRSDG
ncbi:MAG TPA: ABC transporter permease [Vicinamibacterales bacterium]